MKVGKGQPTHGRLVGPDGERVGVGDLAEEAPYLVKAVPAVRVDVLRCGVAGLLDEGKRLRDDVLDLAIHPGDKRGTCEQWRARIRRQVTLDARDIGKSITGDPATLRFSVDGATLKPFYETYGRNSVYLHVTLK